MDLNRYSYSLDGGMDGHVSFIGIGPITSAQVGTLINYLELMRVTLDKDERAKTEA